MYLPGGQDNSIMPYFLSQSLHTALVDYLPRCVRKTSPITNTGEILLSSKPQHTLAALSQGVLALAFARYPADYADSNHAGKSIIHNLESTTLPVWMQSVTWGVAQLWHMGEHYKAYTESRAGHGGSKPPAGDEETKKEHEEYTEDIVSLNTT